MFVRQLLTPFFLACCLLASPAWAMDLNSAMNNLSQAKASGWVGEQPNGYLGVVANQGNAGKIATLINEARRAEYQRLARDNNLQLTDVETMAGKKAIEKTASGHYILVNGKWLKK